MPVNDEEEEEIIEFTTGRKASSFRIVIPKKIVNLMGLNVKGREEKFIVLYNRKEPNSFTVRRISKSELKEFLVGRSKKG